MLASIRDTAALVVKDSVEALHGLLAAGGPAGSERLVATRAKDISHSPFYNLTVGGEPAEKVLVLLYFTQRSAGNLQANGFRLLTDNVLDGSEPSRLQHLKAVPHHGVLTALWPRQLLQSIAISMIACIL